MGKTRLRTGQAAQSNGTTPITPAALQPLRASGVVVTKADLIEALRVYVPQMHDIQVTEDGEHFWLMFVEGEKTHDQAAK